MANNLTLNDWQNAQFVQSAVNASGVILSLAEVMPRISKDVWAAGGGTKEVAHHPIVVMYVATIDWLVHGGIVDPTVYHEASEAVRKAINGLEHPVPTDAS